MSHMYNTIQCKYLPFHMIEALHSVLTADRVQKSVQHCHTYTSSAGSCRGNVARPLIRLRIVSFDAIQIALSVVSTDCVQQIVQHRYAYSASTFAHRRDHLPVGGVRIKSLDTCDRVARTPSTNSEQHFSSSHGLPGSRPRALHQRSLLRQQ